MRDQVFMQGDAGMHHLSFRPVDGLAALAAQHVATARKMLAMLLGEERTEIPAPTIHGFLTWALVPTSAPNRAPVAEAGASPCYGDFEK